VPDLSESGLYLIDLGTVYTLKFSESGTGNSESGYSIKTISNESG